MTRLLSEIGRPAGESGLHTLGTAEHDERVIELGRFTGRPVEVGVDAHFAVLAELESLDNNDITPQVFERRGARQAADKPLTMAAARRRWTRPRRTIGAR